MRWRDVKQNKIPKQEPQKGEVEEKFSGVTNFDKIKAFITDSFLLAMPILYIVVYLVMGDLSSFREDMLKGWLYFLIPLWLVVALFYTVAGQTPGMKAYDIKVVDIKTQKKPNFILASLRYIFFNISLMTIIGPFLMIFRRDKRGIHDLLSQTTLIKAS